VLAKLFRRKKTPVPSMTVQDITHNRPRVGEVRTHGLEEALYLAPLPVCTAQPPVSMQNFSEMNEVYLQMGGSNNGMVFQGVLLAGAIWLTLMVLVFFPILIATIIVVFSPPEIERSFWGLLWLGFQAAVYKGILMGVIGIGTVGYSIVEGVRTQAKQYPLRFNRQRREVCFVDPKTHQVLIVPWESVVAWVSQSEMVTQYGATQFFTFGMGLEDEKNDTVQFVLVGKPSQAHAIGTWEAIRLYMENGIPKDQTGDWLRMLLGRELTEFELRPYEGLHTWEVERWMKVEERLPDSDIPDKERAELNLTPRAYWPLRWWYVRRVLTFWKMPYMIAEWGHKAGYPVLPDEVQRWSQPIPAEQWAKPSPALQKATRTVEEAMRKQKMTFMDACALLSKQAR
jgi:hypothetical protein